MNLAEFFHMLPSGWMFSSDVGRSGGFYGNPNTAGFFIATALPLACIRAGAAKRIFYTTLAIVGVSLTFSRGAVAELMAAIVVTNLFAVGGALKLRKTRLFTLMILAILILLGFFFFTLIQSVLLPYLNHDTMQRLQVFATASTFQRYDLVIYGIQLFLDHPLFGAGVGSTFASLYQQSSHNLVVQIAAEFGLVGLAWLGALWVILWRYPRPINIWFLAVFTASWPFIHWQLETTGFGIAMALYLVTATRMGAREYGSGGIPG